MAPGLGELIAGHPVEGPVRVCAALLDVMAGYETGDPYWAPPPQRPFVNEVGVAPKKMRVAVTTKAPMGATVDAVCAAAAWDTAHLLESLVHTVEEAAPDWGGIEVMRASDSCTLGSDHRFIRRGGKGHRQDRAAQPGAVRNGQSDVGQRLCEGLEPSADLLRGLHQILGLLRPPCSHRSPVCFRPR